MVIDRTEWTHQFALVAELESSCGVPVEQGFRLVSTGVQLKCK